MPLSLQPVIRFMQTAAETNGLYQTRNSVAITNELAKENAGTATKQIPKVFEILRGTKYTPAANGQA